MGTGLTMDRCDTIRKVNGVSGTSTCWQSAYIAMYPDAAGSFNNTNPVAVFAQSHSYPCPADYEYRDNYESKDCLATTCNLYDRDTCCKKKGWPWWAHLLLALAICCCCTL